MNFGPGLGTSPPKEPAAECKGCASSELPPNRYISAETTSLRRFELGTNRAAATLLARMQEGVGQAAKAVAASGMIELHVRSHFSVRDWANKSWSSSTRGPPKNGKSVPKLDGVNYFRTLDGCRLMCVRNYPHSWIAVK